MNKMKEVAELLGVQLNEEFYIKEYGFKYRITESGVECFSSYCKDWKEAFSSNLLNLLKGTLEIQKPILNEKEKKYLETVLRPFRERVEFITKETDDEGTREFIYIDLVDDDLAQFPYFAKGEMYKGMEACKEYTLKELGLFDE